jgi:hypothetical protein
LILLEPEQELERQPVRSLVLVWAHPVPVKKLERQPVRSLEQVLLALKLGRCLT